MKLSVGLVSLAACAAASPAPGRPSRQVALDDRVRVPADVWWLEDFDRGDDPGADHEVRLSGLLAALGPFPLLGDDDDGDAGGAGHGHHGGRHRGRFDNLTLWQLISGNNYTTRSAKALEKVPEMISLLNDTSANHTVFIPLDKDIPPCRGECHEYDNNLVDHIKYHILPGRVPARQVLRSNTLETLFEPESLGHRPQRIRVSIGFFGVKLNYVTKLTHTDITTSNGIIHTIKYVIKEPPSVLGLLDTHPQFFSQLSLGLERTGLRDEVNSTLHPRSGGTLFAPTNGAFTLLGPRINAFLFGGSERGTRLLRKLLEYHMVPNNTLYSDAFYGASTEADVIRGDESQEDDDAADGDGYRRRGHHHLDLPTALDGKPVAVDVARWLRLVSIKVNGRRVSFIDAVASDGVIQTLRSVLIPPRHHKHWQDFGLDEDDGMGFMSVEELERRLGISSPAESHVFGEDYEFPLNEL